MANIIPTVTALAVTYGTGTANTAMGGVFSGSLEKRIRRIDERIDYYNRLKDELIKTAPSEEEEAEIADGSEVLLDSDIIALETDSSCEPINQSMQEIADKIKIISQDHFELTLITKQIAQLENLRTIDRQNQLSSAAQMAMGAGQIAIATSSIGHATAIVAKTVFGFSILSALFYLGASIYGFATALNQLSENRKKQEEMNLALKTLTDLKSGETLGTVKDMEIEMLQYSLDTLKTEEALLVQQRNTQAINIVAALLSLAAMAVFTAGPHGIVYYALLVCSVLLPLIAVAYSARSMNETKYTEALTALLKKAPSIDMAKSGLEAIDSESLGHFQFLISRILELSTIDNDTRQKLNDLIKELNNSLSSPNNSEDKAMRLKSLNELFAHLMKLQACLIRDDLFCRLKIAGVSDQDISKHIAVPTSG